MKSLGRRSVSCLGIKAFTIIETVVYLALLTILLSVLSRVSFGIRQYALFITNNTERLIQRTVATDLIRRDIQAASINENERDDERLVFVQYTIDKKGKIGHCCVGYECKNGILWRYHGDYDF